MSYYAENWLRGPEKELIHQIRSTDGETYYPHITLVRPFAPMTDEENIKRVIIEVCKGKRPPQFSLEGRAAFGDITYVPVTNCEELLQLNDELERALEPYVKFAEKLGSNKTLHVTIEVGGEVVPFPKTDLLMYRLTVIRDKKIWFSYDFVTHEALDRSESLDKQRYTQTVENWRNVTKA